MANNLADRLLKIVKDIEQTKTEKIRVEERIAGAEKQLKEKFGLKNLDEAEKHLKKLQDDMQSTQEAIEEKLDVLEKEYAS